MHRRAMWASGWGPTEAGGRGFGRRARFGAGERSGADATGIPAAAEDRVDPRHVAHASPSSRPASRDRTWRGDQRRTTRSRLSRPCPLEALLAGGLPSFGRRCYPRLRSVLPKTGRSRPQCAPSTSRSRSDYCVVPRAVVCPRRRSLAAATPRRCSARSTMVRGGFALVLAVVLAGGVVGAGGPGSRPCDASIAGRAADAGGVSDHGCDRSRPHRTGRDHLHDPDERGVGRGRTPSRATDAGRPSVGCGRRSRDGRPRDDVGSGDVPHDLGPAGRAREDRSAAREGGPCRVHDAARDDGRGQPHRAHRRPCLDRDRVPDHLHRTGQRRDDPSRHPGRPCASGQRPRGLDR